MKTTPALIFFVVLLISCITATAQEAVKPPVDFDPGAFHRRTKDWMGGEKAKRIKWVAPLGSPTYNRPVLCGDSVVIASNNSSAKLPTRHAKSVDLGCLLAFDRKDGSFLWQYSSPKLDDGDLDYPSQGICSNAAVDGDRLYIVNNRCEVVCLPTDRKRVSDHEAKPIWSFNMMKQLKVIPHFMTSSNPLVCDELVLVTTSNGVKSDDRTVASPNAPDLIALNKKGQCVWQTTVAGRQLLDGQWSSPVLLPGDKPDTSTVVYAAGNGWLFSWSISKVGVVKKFSPLWKCDLNPKTSQWNGGGVGDRNIVLSTPVWCEKEHLLLVATGQDPEAGEGVAVFWAIDPVKAAAKARVRNNSGEDFLDVSETLVVGAEKRSEDKRRVQACDADKGEREVPNPDSALVWKYRGTDPATEEFEKEFHRTLGTPAVAGGLVFVGDFSGLIHCLDLKSGRALWVHDAMSSIWSSPVVIGNMVYLGTSEGDLLLFEASAKFKLVRTIKMGAPIHAPVVFDGQTLYIPTNRYLFAVE